MTELPIVVNMTVDASPTEYDLKAETNQQALSLSSDIVIDTSGQALPLYEGPYTVNAGLNAVTLDTDGKRMAQDVTVNALQQMTLNAPTISVNSSNGQITASVNYTPGYNDMYVVAPTMTPLSTQARATITPTASEQTAVARGKYTTGVVKVRAISSPYADVSGVTATASDVLSGKYFVDSSGALILGTGTGGGGMDTETKDALLECFEHVAWIDTDGQIYYNNLLNALYPLQSISAVYTQSGTVTPSTPLDDLKSDLVVTATFKDGTVKTVTNYTLSGTLTAGTSTVTVTYFTETTTFNVTVTSITVNPELRVNTSITSSNNAVPYMDSNTASSRATGVLTTGTYPFREGSATSTTYSNYYPVPIPAGSTGVTISSNDTDMSVIEAYYPSDDWIRITSSGWLLKSSSTTHTYNFSGANRTHIWLVFRQAGRTTGGSVTQTMLDNVQFTWNF